MKIYYGKGDSINIIAPFNLTGGQGLQIKAIFGIVGADTLAGLQAALHLVGEMAITTKVSAQTWAVGDSVYWDNDLKNFANATVSGGIKIGVVTEIAASGQTNAKIRLNGTF
jgi:predicted RecA/RadA family phage recombinase